MEVDERKPKQSGSYPLRIISCELMPCKCKLFMWVCRLISPTFYFIKGQGLPKIIGISLWWCQKLFPYVSLSCFFSMVVGVDYSLFFKTVQSIWWNECTMDQKILKQKGFGFTTNIDQTAT